MKKMIGCLSLFLCLSAKAGVMNGGGGKGVVCRDSKKVVQSVELLDLWEARVIYGRIPLNLGLSLENEVDRLLNSLKNSIFSRSIVMNTESHGYVTGPFAFKQMLKNDTDAFLQKKPNVHWLVGAKLKLTQDSFETAKPADCKIEQLVRYSDNNVTDDILVNKDLVEKMDVVNQAALYAHEAFYVYLRRAGEKSSIRIRRAIGLVSSGYQFLNPESDFEGKPLMACYPSGPSNYPYDRAYSVLYIYKSKNQNKLAVYVDMIDGRYMIGNEPAPYPIQGNVDDIFRQSHVEYTSLGKVGFDYNIVVMFETTSSGERQANFHITSAPDQKGSSNYLGASCFPYTEPFPDVPNPFDPETD